MAVKRWKMAGVTTLAVITLLASGCTPEVSGVDLDLTDDWAALPAGEPFKPAVGSCHKAKYAETGTLGAYDPVSCASDHYGETVHVGQFTGPAAEGSSAPNVSTEIMNTAFAECDKEATAYVGQEWRNGRLSLKVTVPGSQAWSGGARWFRCDLNELTNVTEDPEWVQRKASLKGSMEPALRLGCFSQSGSGDTIKDLPEVDCAKEHNAEYTGSFIAPANKSYPKETAEWSYFHDQCRNTVAQFVGISRDAAGKYGVISWPYRRDAWAGGDRGVRCFLWLDKKSMTGSAKDSGGKNLPA
jgi:hypothetical protein